MGDANSGLAPAFPLLSFIVQDFETRIEAEERELPEALVGRCMFTARDSFKQQPIK